MPHLEVLGLELPVGANVLVGEHVLGCPLSVLLLQPRHRLLLLQCRLQDCVCKQPVHGLVRNIMLNIKLECFMYHEHI